MSEMLKKPPVDLPVSDAVKAKSLGKTDLSKTDVAKLLADKLRAAVNRKRA